MLRIQKLYEQSIRQENDNANKFSFYDNSLLSDKANSTGDKSLDDDVDDDIAQKVDNNCNNTTISSRSHSSSITTTSSSSSDYEEEIQIPPHIYSYFYSFVDDSSSISNSTMTSFSSTTSANTNNIATPTLISSSTSSSSSTEYIQSINEKFHNNVLLTKQMNEITMPFANSKQNNYCIIRQRKEIMNDTFKDRYYVNDKGEREDGIPTNFSKNENFHYPTFLHNVSPMLDSDDESVNSVIEKDRYNVLE